MLWREAYRALRDAVMALPPTHPSRSAFDDVVPESWFLALCARSHLNAFRVEAPRPLYTDTSTGTSSSVSSSSLYTTGSTTRVLPSSCTTRHSDPSNRSSDRSSSHSTTSSSPPLDYSTALTAAAAGTVSGGGGFDDTPHDDDDDDDDEMRAASNERSRGSRSSPRGSGLGAVATRMGSAVYFIPSLCNHSCDPNVDVGFEDGSSRMTLRARREIEAGEELSITYVDAGLPRETRQRTLLQGYGFTCMCPACREGEI